MEAAAAAVKSYKVWSRGEHTHCPAQKHMHSQSLHVSACRLQAPSASTSLNIEQRLGDGCVSIETTRRRSKTKYQSSPTNIFSTSCINTTPIITKNNINNNATTTTTTKNNMNITKDDINSTTTATTHNNTHNDSLAPTFRRRPEHDEVGVQELTVYEMNEGDRGSPVLLFSSKLATDWYTRLHNLGGLGDLVPFSNKLFDGSLKKRLGITAGIISVIRYYPKEGGFLFESVYSFYFGDYGHISVKGPYKTHEDTILTVTGGSGTFNGVYGTVEISNVEFPRVLFYKFKLHGIPQLPQALRWKTIPPTKGLRPSHNASSPGVALPNFTD